MNNLLRIDASSQINESYSRRLGDYFESRWHIAHPHDRIVSRDLVDEAIEHIRQPTITGFYTPEEEMTGILRSATSQSDTLIEELKAADILLITTPMYNFSVPSALKAWIDQIVRAGYTFSYDGVNFKGLLRTKQAFLICAYGAQGYVNGGPMEGANFLLPYLEFLLGFLGVEKIDAVSMEATTGDDAVVAANFEKAKIELDRLA